MSQPPTIKAEGEVDAIENPCKICLLTVSKYSCPRCNLQYCSVACYQSVKHSSCSEAFYKDWVIEELKDSTNSPDDRQRVLEMLAKDMEGRVEDEEEEDEEESLNERLQGLDLDKDVSAVWGRLTDKEKEEFAHMLQDGRLARLIEIWTPWWIVKANHKLVIDEAERQAQEPSMRMPQVCTDVPDISVILKNSRPSANCRYDTLNVLTAYAFVARLHNGCQLECPIDSSQDLLDTCAVLQKSQSCSSVGEGLQLALDAVTKKTKDSDKFSNEFNLTLLRDVNRLVSGPGKGHTLTLKTGLPGQGHSTTFMSAALSNVLALMQVTLAILKKEIKDKERSGDTDTGSLRGQKSSLFKAEKKVSFLLSWLQRYGAAMHPLMQLVTFEIETRETELHSVEEIKTAVEEHMDKLKPVTSDPTDPVTSDITKPEPFIKDTVSESMEKKQEKAKIVELD